MVRGDTWLSQETLLAFASCGEPTILVDGAGTQLAWCGNGPDQAEDLGHQVAGAGDFLMTYPWDLLRANERVIGAIDQNRIEGTVSDGATINGHVHLGAGSILLPGTYVEGNVVIGRNCRIGPNCYLRGNSSIGDGCRIGHSVEIKNSIIFPGSAIGHLSYCGDSVIGSQVNFGAGTIAANFRHDGANHRTEYAGKLIDTGRRKFGTIMGDGVHTGIHTSIYPGRKLWPGVSTRPGDIVRKDLRSTNCP
jgi:bifunctional UDP-N-acetylglucosamine pyrophosphorylase/glucosamine-1-phosphate N-acetyltransferase